jgi:predicted anti-sigma-YlaC factor YlaD
LNYLSAFASSIFRGLRKKLLGHLAVAALVIGLSACSPTALIKKSLGDELAKQGQSQEEDPGLAREASAFYLKLSESLLKDTPDNLKLAEAVGAGLCQYTFAYVAFEAERLAATDAQAAYRTNERAKRLYLRAHRHLMRALELSTPGFRAQLAQHDANQWPRIAPDQVGLAYWAAASWGGYISLAKDSPDAVADFPLAYRLATLAWKVNPNFGNGGLSSLMGSFESAQPGGSLAKATQYFDAAIAISQGQNAGAYIAKAESIALAQGQREAFETLLTKAIEVSDKHPDLSNALMRERALWLLRSADDLF